MFCVITCFEMTSCQFTSPVWLLIANWIMVELSSDLAQLLYFEPSLIITSYFLAPLCCSCLGISMKESRRCFSCCHSLAPLILTDSLSLNTYYLDCWLQVVTSATTLIGTLLVLNSLSVVVALKLTSLVLNMLCTLFFLGHSLHLCSMLE